MLSKRLLAEVRGKLVKLYYQNLMNAAESLRVYRRNHLQKRGPCTPQGLRYFIKKFTLEILNVI